MAAVADFLEEGAEFFGFLGEVGDEVFSLADVFGEVEELAGF